MSAHGSFILPMQLVGTVGGSLFKYQSVCICTGATPKVLHPINLSELAPFELMLEYVWLTQWEYQV